MKRTLQGHCRFWKYTLLKAHWKGSSESFRFTWKLVPGELESMATHSVHGFRGSIDDVCFGHFYVQQFGHNAHIISTWKQSFQQPAFGNCLKDSSQG